jgi:hypothetical protein
VRISSDQLTSTDAEDIDRDEERNLGVSVGQERRRTSTTHEDVSDTANPDTSKHHLEPTSLGIREPGEEERKRVGQHGEGLGDGGGLDGTHSKGTSGSLTRGRSTVTISAVWHRSVDEVGEQRLNTVVWIYD